MASVRQQVIRKQEETGSRGSFNKDMTNDEMTFEAHKQIVKPLRKNARVCVR